MNALLKSKYISTADKASRELEAPVNSWVVDGIRQIPSLHGHKFISTERSASWEVGASLNVAVLEDAHRIPTVYGTSPFTTGTA